jgi:hypothetical protein
MPSQPRSRPWRTRRSRTPPSSSPRSTSHGATSKEALPAIRARLDELKKKDPTTETRIGRNPGLDLADYLLALDAIASTDPELNVGGEELANRLIELARNYNHFWVIGRVCHDLAQFRARRAGAPAEGIAADPGLALWSSRHAAFFATERAGQDRALWAESGGMVGHVVGSSSQFGAADLLMFRYPLVGTFEFSVDAYAEGTVGYGGLFAEPIALDYRPTGVRSLGYGEMVARPGLFARSGSYNRITIRVAPGKVSYLVNGHLFYEDTRSSATSPWLVLIASGHRQAAFRNPTLAGRPEIPARSP